MCSTLLFPLFTISSVSLAPTPRLTHTQRSFGLGSCMKTYNKKKQTLKYAYAKRNFCVERPVCSAFCLRSALNPNADAYRVSRRSIQMERSHPANENENLFAEAFEDGSVWGRNSRERKSFEDLECFWFETQGFRSSQFIKLG